jgi:hypothetical protein
MLFGIQDNKPRRKRFHFEAFWSKLQGFPEAVAAAWQSALASPEGCPFISLHQLEIANAGETSQRKKCGYGTTSRRTFWPLHHSSTLSLNSAHESDGDRRTGMPTPSFFHLHSKHRKRKNCIAKIVANGQILTGHEDKAKAVNEFYENLLGTYLDRSRSINLAKLGIARHNLATLERPFTEDEVWDTLKKTSCR